MQKLLKRGLVAAACAVSMLAGFGSAHAEGYEFINLFDKAFEATGIRYDLRSTPYEMRPAGITDSGTVVGYLRGSYPDRSKAHVLTWDVNSGGTVTDYGYLGSNSGSEAYAYGNSENGQIAVTAKVKEDRLTAYKSFTYDTATSTLTSLTSDNPTHLALDVNNSGTAVGWVSPKALTRSLENAGKTAFISNADGEINYIPGAYVGTEYGENMPGSVANAINNAGLVTGYTTVDGNSRAFLYDSASEDFTTLGTLGGGLTSVGTDVNDLGVVVGYATRADDVERAFLYYGGTMVDLGSLTTDGTSQAHAINDKGDIVGTSNGRAFLYSNGQMVDLNDYVDPFEGIFLVSACGINNSGQIVGYGVVMDYVDGSGTVYYHEAAFALTPTPVPASVLLFGSGIAGLALFRRKVQA